MDLIFITNEPGRAAAVEAAGVDRVMVDLEIEGKAERQAGRDAVLSGHSLDDVSAVRRVLHSAELLVRVNPLTERSEDEIEACVSRGADRLMLPMFRRTDEVARFLDLVNGRVNTTLLLETPAALACLDQFVLLPGVTEVHFGLNDLHLSLGLDFMFEILAEGLLEPAATLLRERQVRFGIGGVAPLGSGLLPAEHVLREHARLGSSAVILSRDFGRLFDSAASPEDAADRFEVEVRRLRQFMASVIPGDLDSDRRALRAGVRRIVASRTLP